MKQKILLTLAVAIIVITNSCKDDIVGPQPGSRNYEWTVDTIKIFSNYIHQIWGSAPDNIFGVGPGGALNTTIWHYDGKAWTTDYISRNVAPWCIYGFSKNDVWIAGQDGKIWRYNGVEWKENYQHKIGNFTGITFYDLYGTSSHDLYAVGTAWFDNETRRGIILHYNGIRWEQKFLADFNSYFAQIRKSSESDGKIFITCVKFGPNDTTTFYDFSGTALKEIYSDKEEQYKGGWLGTIGGTAFFSLSSGIYKYTNDSFQTHIKLNLKTSGGFISGRNEKDIFISMQNGIYHYNGNDISQLKSTGNWWIDGGIIFDKEAFFIVNDWSNSKSLIYKGKLNE